MPAMATIEPPACLEQRPRRAAEPHLGEELQFEARGPVGVGEREEIAAAVGAGIVDQDIEPAEAVFGEAREPGRLALAAQIGGMDFGPAAQRPNGLRGGFERVVIARREQQHRSPQPQAPSAMALPMPRLAPVTSATLF